MRENFTIYSVDDDVLVLELIHQVLDSRYVIECFNDVSSCREALDTGLPDMFLLDVRMPDIDGYRFCQELKGNPASSHIPVTFVSSQDTLEARLQGYDAGGDDFILKPFDTDELLRKVQVTQQMIAKSRQIRQQLDDSEMLSSLVMANMDEYAILVRFLREVISCDTSDSVAECMLDMLRRYGLDCVVQVRSGVTTLTLGAKGRNLPIEESVIQHVRGLDRIFEFRNRSVHNFEHVTLLINNMPVDDAELCGRLRDHLSIAAEAAEARMQALKATAANIRNTSGIEIAMKRIQQITTNLRLAYLEDSTASSDLLMHFESALAKSFVSLGLTEGQERELGEMVSSFTEELMRLLERGIASHEPLHEVSRELELLLS